MKYKICELEGALLNQAVGYAINEPGHAFLRNFSADWAIGGPLIERYKVDVWYEGLESWAARVCHETGGYEDATRLMSASSTPLIAAMRAIVNSRFGEEVEL